MILTQTEWNAIWRPADPLSLENRRLGLNAYAEKLAQLVKQAMVQHGLTPTQASNIRYEVYIEGLLAEGVPVPDEIIATIDPEANRYRDVPLVGKRLREMK